MKQIYNLTTTKTPFLCNSVFTKIFLLERKKLKSLMWSNNATYHIYKQTSKNYIWVPTNRIILINENKTKIQRLIFRKIFVYYEVCLFTVIFQYIFTILHFIYYSHKSTVIYRRLHSLLHIIQSFFVFQRDERKTI